MGFKMLKINLLFLGIVFFVFSCLSSPDAKYQETGKLREKVKKYNLEKYAKGEYDLAEKNFNDGKDLIDKKNSYKANKVLDDANKYYKVILEKGLPPCTEDKNNEVKLEKKNAEDIKANVAVKDQFSDADKIYNEGLAHKEKKEYESAIDSFSSAENQFKQIYSTTKDKKDKTERSISSTEQIQKDIETYAVELEKKLKGNELKDSTGDGGKK
jgi:tetratricopeptide (TPR) repeat protein